MHQTSVKLPIELYGEHESYICTMSQYTDLKESETVCIHDHMMA